MYPNNKYSGSFAGDLRPDGLQTRFQECAAPSAAPFLKRTIEMDKKFANLGLAPTREVEGDL